jgi:hypothetical protein
MPQSGPHGKKAAARLPKGLSAGRAQSSGLPDPLAPSPASRRRSGQKTPKKLCQALTNPSKNIKSTHKPLISHHKPLKTPNKTLTAPRSPQQPQHPPASPLRPPRSIPQASSKPLAAKIERHFYTPQGRLAVRVARASRRSQPLEPAGSGALWSWPAGEEARVGCQAQPKQSLTSPTLSPSSFGSARCLFAMGLRNLGAFSLTPMAVLFNSLAAASPPKRHPFHGLRELGPQISRGCQRQEGAEQPAVSRFGFAAPWPLHFRAALNFSETVLNNSLPAAFGQSL